MAIVEGVFTEIGEYNMKVGKKTGDNNQYLKDVIIHQKLKGRPGSNKSRPRRISIRRKF
jgi:lipopolysaccharide export system permease protein